MDLISVLDMLTKGVDRCNDIARNGVLDMFLSGIEGIDILCIGCDLVTLGNDECRCGLIGLGMLTKGVDGCKDISSRMTIIDNENWLKYGLRRCGLLETVIDNEIWLKCGLRRYRMADIQSLDVGALGPEMNRVRPKPAAQANCPLEKSGRVVVEYGLSIDFRELVGPPTSGRTAQTEMEVIPDRLGSFGGNGVADALAESVYVPVNRVFADCNM